jgi:hypothetical protein
LAPALAPEAQLVLALAPGAQLDLAVTLNNPAEPKLIVKDYRASGAGS